MDRVLIVVLSMVFGFLVWPYVEAAFKWLSYNGVGLLLFALFGVLFALVHIRAKGW